MGRVMWHRIIACWGAMVFSSSAYANPPGPPCDRYPMSKQDRCAAIWKELNQEDGPAIAQFGLDQQQRREAGRITAEQHLAENMTFIKQSTEKRLKRLRDRMLKE